MTYKGCFGCETKWFWSNSLVNDFLCLSVPADSETMLSFWHHSLCLIQFQIGSLICFRTVSGAMPEQSFSSRDKREELLTKFDGLIYLILLMILWYHTSLFSLFLKNINISKFNVLKLNFWQFCNYLLYFITSSKNSFEQVLTNLIILFSRVIVFCIILHCSDIWVGYVIYSRWLFFLAFP